MDKSGASAYVYAKASGMLANSFVGPRAVKLFQAKSLSELWTLVFDTQVPLVPEVMLAQQLERKAEERFIADFSMLLGCYSKPEPVSLALLQYYDFCNIKDIAHAIMDKQPVPENLVDIGKHSMLNLKAYPDIAKITEGSPLSWYKKVPERAEQKDVDHRLDAQYMHSLWAACQKIPAYEREPVEKLIKEELVLNNCLWAIRLKNYYGMTDEEIKAQLVPLHDVADENDPLAGEAVKLLKFAFDTPSDWEKWKYADFLNPAEPGVPWFIDPRYVQQKAKVAMNKRALKLFHQHPFTDCVLVTWFKIKQYEMDCIRTAAEGLRLLVNEQQVKDFAGVVE